MALDRVKFRKWLVVTDLGGKGYNSSSSPRVLIEVCCSVQAKYNILNGHYPLDRRQGESFGAILALTEYGKFSPQIHRLGYFR